jgi:hypothetical protein
VRDPKRTPVARWDDPQAIASSGVH